MADFSLFPPKNFEHTFLVARNPIKIRCSNTDFFTLEFSAKLKSIYAIIFRLPGFVLYYHSPLFCTGLSDLFDPIQITIQLSFLFHKKKMYIFFTYSSLVLKAFGIISK